MPYYSIKHLKDRTLHTGVFTLFEDDYPLHHHIAEEDHETADKLRAFVHRHKRSNIKNMIQSKRLKRGIEEVESIEEYVNSMDSSHFGNIENITDGSISVSFINVPAGEYNLIVYVDNIGKALGSFNITSQGIITSVWPTSGSTYGGQEVTLTGQGFHANDSSLSSVSFGSINCVITDVTFR